MRPATKAAAENLIRHGEGRRALVLYHLATASGLRIFCRTAPPDALLGTSGLVRFADGSWVADGSALAGEGSEAVLGVHDWVVDGGGFSAGKSAGRSPLDVFQEKEISGLTLTLSNEVDADGHPQMSRILAQEPVVGGKVDVRVGFEGCATGDVLSLASFAVRRVVERRDVVTLECEAV